MFSLERLAGERERVNSGKREINTELLLLRNEVEIEPA